MARFIALSAARTGRRIAESAIRHSSSRRILYAAKAAKGAKGAGGICYAAGSQNRRKHGRNCQFGGRKNTARARAAGRVDGRAAYNADIAAKTFFRRRQSRAGCRGKFGAVDSHGNTRQIRIIRKGGARAQIGAAMIIRLCVMCGKRFAGARCPNCAPPPRAVSAVSAVFGNAARKKIAYRNARRRAPVLHPPSSELPPPQAYKSARDISRYQIR